MFVAFQGHGDGTRRLTTAAAIALAIGFAASAGAAQEHIFDCIIDPSATVLVGSPVPGLLEQVLVDRGDFVEQGQIVARLESRVEAAAVAADRERAVRWPRRFGQPGG